MYFNLFIFVLNMIMVKFLETLKLLPSFILKKHNRFLNSISIDIFYYILKP